MGEGPQAGDSRLSATRMRIWATCGGWLPRWSGEALRSGMTSVSPPGSCGTKLRERVLACAALVVVSGCGGVAVGAPGGRALPVEKHPDLSTPAGRRAIGVFDGCAV